MTVLLVAGFVQIVPAGHVIEDAAAGTFRSRFTAARLVTLAAGRAVRWREVPPPRGLVRFSREDQCLAEAVWHIQARNAAWTSG
jgi:hypothetical protein